MKGNGEGAIYFEDPRGTEEFIYLGHSRTLSKRRANHENNMKIFVAAIPGSRDFESSLHAIDLDPASCPKANECVRAKYFYSQYFNGLDLELHGLEKYL